MNGLRRRLLALEGGPPGPFDDLSDGELAERLNETYAQLRPLGFAYADINPSNPDTLELQMMILATTRWLHGEDADLKCPQNTENVMTQSIGEHHAEC